MTKSNYTHLSLVVDRSGSMGSMAQEAQEGINNLIKEQAAIEGSITVTLYQFDNDYEKVFGPIDAKDAPIYQLHPRGMTALLDSANKAIIDTGAFLRNKPESERPSKVIFVIVTDGYENASQEIQKPQLKKLIENQTNQYDWEFIYLGANVDAIAESQSMGIKVSTQYAGTGASMSGTYANLNSSLSHARIAGKSVSSTLTANVDAEGNAVE